MLDATVMAPLPSHFTSDQALKTSTPHSLKYTALKSRKHSGINQSLTFNTFITARNSKYIVVAAVDVHCASINLDHDLHHEPHHKLCVELQHCSVFFIHSMFRIFGLANAPSLSEPHPTLTNVRADNIRPMGKEEAGEVA